MPTKFMAVVQISCAPVNQSGALPASVARFNSRLFDGEGRADIMVLAIFTFRPAMYKAMSLSEGKYDISELTFIVHLVVHFF